MIQFHGTTIIAVRKNGRVALGGDGQVSIEGTILKARANKVRTLKGGRILAGFAGSVADALTLFERFEEKFDRYPGNLTRAADTCGVSRRCSSSRTWTTSFYSAVPAN
jgi:ATP-dependent HslUV protease subunit HslV